MGCQFVPEGGLGLATVSSLLFRHDYTNSSKGSIDFLAKRHVFSPDSMSLFSSRFFASSLRVLEVNIFEVDNIRLIVMDLNLRVITMETIPPLGA